jgi:Flp pilus assembly protein TadG
MRWKIQSFVRRFCKDQRGSILILATITIASILGLLALAIDTGQILYAQNRLQATADMAALAGAKYINNASISATQMATLYSGVYSGTGTIVNHNVDPNFVVTMPTPAQLTCVSGTTPIVLPQCGGPWCGLATPCSSPGNNALIVTQQTTPTLFLAQSFFGFKSPTLTATSTALASGGGAYPPLHVIIVLDTTNQMGQTDTACGMTKLACAKSGLLTFLQQLWPCTGTATTTSPCPNTPLVQVGLMVFPGLVNSASVGINYCASAGTPQSASYLGMMTMDSGGASGSTLTFTPGPSPTVNTKVADDGQQSTSAAVIPNGTTVASVTPSTGPTTSTGTASVNLSQALVPPAPPGTIQTGTGGDQIYFASLPLYQVVPLSNDYKSSSTSNSGTALNTTNSNLVKALGGVAGCAGAVTAFTPASVPYVGTGSTNFGAYYAGAIAAAQASLLAAHQPGVQDVIIFISDGNPGRRFGGGNNTLRLNATAASTGTTLTFPAGVSPAIVPGLSVTGGTIPAGTTVQSTTPTTIMISAGGTVAAGAGITFGNQCQASINAAQTAAANTTTKTIIYSISYGTARQNCFTDTATISNCQVMQAIASDSSRFFTDVSSAGCPASPYTVTQVFKQVAAALQVSRLMSAGVQ